MPLDSTGAEVRNSGTLESPKAIDVALSPDGSRIYAVGVIPTEYGTDITTNGDLRIYNADTGELLDTIAVGISLGAVTVSPDGRSLVVIEQRVLSTNGSGWDRVAEVTVYHVDLETRQVTSFPYTVQGSDRAFSDAAYLSDGTVLLSQSGVPNELKILDPVTGHYSHGPVLIDGDAVFTSTANGSAVLISFSQDVDATLQIYRPGLGLVAARSGFQDVYTEGIQAITDGGDGVPGRVAFHIPGSGIHIYDLALNAVVNLSDLYGRWAYTVSGVAFDSSGMNLFVLDSSLDAVVQISTADWTIVNTVAVGASADWFSGVFGNNLLVGPEARYFTVINEDSLIQVDNPNASSTIAADVGGGPVFGTALFDNIVGSAQDDAILAGAGNDIVYAEAGNDSLIGGAGDDTLDGGAGTDTVDYWRASSGVTVDLAALGSNATGEGSDTLISIENVEGSSFDDRIWGDGGRNLVLGRAGDDIIYGRAGADLLFGGIGNDTLDGGADHDRVEGGDGNDILAGGEGDDILDGGAGTDTADFWSAIQRVVVDLGGSGTNALGEGTDTLISIENVDGTRFDDRLFGDGGANMFLGRDGSDSLFGRGGADVLFGGSGNDELDGGADNDRLEGASGNDILVGGSGDDILDGGDDIDTVDYWTATQRVVVDLAGSGTNALGDGVDTLIGIENIEATGFNDRLFGDAGANLFLGRGGEDAMFGRGGDDLLFGGSGNDELDGGAGADRLEGGLGNDTLDGGPGDDILTGDDGADTFVFRDLGGSDRITDLSSEDRIDLRLLDANTAAAGDQAFAFIGGAQFTSSGQVRTYSSGGMNYAAGDTNGDGVADFVIGLGSASVSSAHFWL